MKSLKRILLLALCFVLVATALTSCGGCKHVDDNGDGVCEKCEKEYESVPKDIPLIDKSGNVLFQFVLAGDLNSKIKMNVLSLVEDLDDIDVEVDVVEDKEETKKPCEVLIGNVESRGPKFFFEEHSLGNKGYVIKIIDEKIVINGGSESALSDALNIFIEEILGFDGDEIWDVTMKANQVVDETQSGYDITSIKINGNDIKGYTIAANPSNTSHYNAAKNLQQTLYSRAGYWLEIVSLDKADKSIVIKSQDKVYGEDSFKITASGTQLIVECAFDNKFNDTFSQFLTANITNGEGDINFEGSVFKKDISFITYEEFEATDNGSKDNDYEAIYKAHVEANKSGQKIIISGSPTYYLGSPKVGSSYVEIPIMTDTDWGNAKFIIDDSKFNVWNDADANAYNKHVFVVKPSKSSVKVLKKDLSSTIKLEPGMTKIDFAPGQDALIRPTYQGHRIYRRRAYWTLSLGSNSSEIIKVDKDGNISEETPVMWSYASIDYIEVFYIDEEPLTIEGGVFTTKASKNSVYKENAEGKMQLRDNYFARGLKVTRSNTTVKGVEHYIENEITLKEHSEDLLVGNTYMGFFIASTADSVTFLDCILTGHRCFTKPKGWEGSGTQGTYDFHANYSNNVVLKNCHQSNFWVTVDSQGKITPATKDTPGAVSSMAREQVFKNPNISADGALMHWGVGETDFCKNLEYNGCTLSRYDAHQGLYNGKIINTEINIIALTGMGEMIIEGSTQYSLDPDDTYNNLIHMRGDYGSTWDGEIKIKDHKAYLYRENYNGQAADSYVFMHSYANWYMGYECAYPSITLDNVQYFDAATYYKSRETEAFPASAEILLNTGDHIKNEPGLHLETTKDTAPLRQYSDYNGDGLIDTFYDFGNGKGKDFNGDTKIDDADKVYDVKFLSDRTLGESSYSYGVKDDGSRENLNPVKPPEHIKVLNNTAGVKYVVTRTDNLGVADGGFFGETKFYYAADEFYTGTGAEKDPNENTFVFK